MDGWMGDDDDGPRRCVWSCGQPIDRPAHTGHAPKPKVPRTLSLLANRAACAITFDINDQGEALASGIPINCHLYLSLCIWFDKLQIRIFAVLG